MAEKLYAGMLLSGLISNELQCVVGHFVPPAHEVWRGRGTGLPPEGKLHVISVIQTADLCVAEGGRKVVLRPSPFGKPEIMHRALLVLLFVLYFSLPQIFLLYNP